MAKNKSTKFSIVKLITIGSSVLGLIELFQDAKEDGTIDTMEIVGFANALISILETLGVDIPEDLRNAVSSGDLAVLLDVVEQIISELRNNRLTM